MNNCEHILEEICGVLCEDINSDLCTEIKEHLKTCPKCSAYVASIKRTIGLVKCMKVEEEVPEDIHNRLQKMLEKNCYE